MSTVHEWMIELREAYPISWKNIDSDPLLTDDQREMCYDVIREKTDSFVALNGAGGSIEGLAKNICHGLWDLAENGGCACQLVDQSLYYFGRVQSEESIYDALVKDGRPWKPDRDTWMKALYGQTLDGQKRRIGTLLLWTAEQTRFVWFQQKHPKQPRKGLTLTRSELVDVLGLECFHSGDHQYDKLVTWSHEVPASEIVRRPSFVDAGLREQWQPGGKTRPMSPDKAGLDEAVHYPISGSCLREEIRELT